MPRTRIIIDRSPESVWIFFTEPSNWISWWGAAIQRVSPGWQDGARIVWANNNTSKITSFSRQKKLQISSNFMQHTFYFSPIDGNSTKLEVEFSPMGGAAFSDGGSAHLQTLNSNLKDLKKQIEGGK